jgi:SAM-dependent methyltransferase
MHFYYQIEKFVIDLALQIDNPSKKILDIGAGTSPYRKYFKNIQYYSQDFAQNNQHTINFVLDINKDLGQIKNKSFDYILCTQVLEHTKNPESVMREINRILKPGGKLFLTTNFIYQIHSAPNDYYRFTQYGLTHLGEVTGYKINSLISQGGVFHCLSYISITLPIRLGLREGSGVYWIYILLFSPLIMIINLLSIVLDMFDYKRELTINYAVTYEKI